WGGRRGPWAGGGLRPRRRGRSPHRAGAPRWSLPQRGPGAEERRSERGRVSVARRAEGSPRAGGGPPPRAAPVRGRLRRLECSCAAVRCPKPRKTRSHPGLLPGRRRAGAPRPCSTSTLLLRHTSIGASSKPPPPERTGGLIVRGAGRMRAAAGRPPRPGPTSSSLRQGVSAGRRAGARARERRRRADRPLFGQVRVSGRPAQRRFSRRVCLSPGPAACGTRFGSVAWSPSCSTGSEPDRVRAERCPMATTNQMIQFFTEQYLASHVQTVYSLDDEAFLLLDPNRKTVIREITTEEMGGVVGS